jgi:hypothetical protein
MMVILVDDGAEVVEVVFVEKRVASHMDPRQVQLSKKKSSWNIKKR